MHKPCKVILFAVLGMILALMFLLVATCGKHQTPTPGPVPIPVPSAPSGQEPIPPPVVSTPPAEPSTPPIEPIRTHTVVCGDTLWDISGSTVKEPYKWREIWKLNKEVVEKPHLIYPGEILVLPN